MSLYLVIDYQHFHCCLELLSDCSVSMLSSCEAWAPCWPQVQALPLVSDSNLKAPLTYSLPVNPSFPHEQTEAQRVSLA